MTISSAAIQATWAQAVKTSQRLAGYGDARVQVPAGSLAALTTVGEELAPESAGLSEAQIEKIVADLENLYRSGAYPAMSFALRKRGKLVLNRAIGHARGNAPIDARDAEKVLIKPETPVCLFSASKAVTAILAHKLAEEGGIELDAPVARYWPAFGRKGKALITVRDILSHRAGIPGIALEKHDRAVERLNDWDWICDHIANAKVGRLRMVAYHAITGGFVIGEIIQRITGKPMTAYHEEKLRKPLGMKHFTYGLPAQYRGDVAENAAAGMPVMFPIAPILERALIVPFSEVVAASNTDAFMDAVIPAGNIYATAEETSRFFQMLLDGGVYNGKAILKNETIARAVKPVGYPIPDATLMLPMHYSEGMMMGGPMSLYGPFTTGAYGHLGFMNILGWADPKRDISCALLVTGKAVLGPHLLPWMKLLATIGTQTR
ncbi:MAG: serine hydrolase domain-containing protein [Pseudomonadota bacterium]